MTFYEVHRPSWRCRDFYPDGGRKPQLMSSPISILTMPSRSLWSPNTICLRCQWRLWNRNNRCGQFQSLPNSLRSKPSRQQRRPLHATANVCQITTIPENTTSDFLKHLQQLESLPPHASNTPNFDPVLIPRLQKVPLREHLLQWQRQYGKPSEEVLVAFERHPARGDTSNDISKSCAIPMADDAQQLQWSAFDDNENGDLITIGLFLKPGDVVELSQPGRESVLAVFVQQLERDSQFFSIDGRWRHSALGQVAFAIPRCIDPTLLEPLLPYLPTDSAAANPKGEVHVPVKLGAPVQRILEQMTEEAEKIYRANAPILDTAYDVLADDKRVRIMTLKNIAKTLLSSGVRKWNPNPAALLAVRKSLLYNEFRFRHDKRSHRLTNIFAIRPKQDVKDVETAHEWIREHQEYLAACANPSKNTTGQRQGATNVKLFLEKARRLIALSRQDRDLHDGILGPSKTRATASGKSSLIETVLGEKFTTTDKKIINFLQAWVLTDQFVGMAGYQSACASLVMATNCYGPGSFQNSALAEMDEVDMSRSTGYVFLQEIGVIQPFENRAIYNEHLMLPTVRITRNLELLNEKAELLSKDPQFQDSMADLRRDWGSTTIYCIDDPGAQEIDDGVSIERIGDSSEFWIHVHVANPTSHFDKAHVLTGLAAHLTESVYTPERSFPMLPPWASAGFFSLKSGRPILTFSSRIDASGNVLEHKIQPGIARKVVTLSPSEVSSIIGEGVIHDSHTFTVGGDIPNTEAKSTPKVNVNKAQIQDLEDLYAAAKVLWRKRRAAGGIRMTNIESRIHVFEHPERSGLTWFPPSLDQARHMKGDPIIQIKTQNTRGLLKFEINASNIVEEMMMLACTTAASWCAERGVPVMYRGTINPPRYGAESTEDLRSRLLMPHYEQHGEIPRSLALRYINSLGRAITHAAPIPHKIIGVPAYVKVTSPLRRFGDMVAHWQIEAVIRHEAKSGKKLSPADLTETQAILPFSKNQIEDSIVSLTPKERTIQQTKRASSRFWSNVAMMRAFYHNEASLPDTFKIWVKFIPENFKAEWVGAQGILLDYGVEARLIDLSDVQLGDEWEVAIKHVHVFTGIVYVKPVRLLHRDGEID